MAPPAADYDDEEDEDEIDEEQVEDYCAMLDGLGNFPEKVKINSLTMAAEDFSESIKSATTIYECIRTRLVDRTTPGISSPDRKLPLVYVLDSMLKNIKGVYVQIIEGDAATWMATVYDIFDAAQKEDEKNRLKKVWNTWKTQGVIQDEAKWRKIGQCFMQADEKVKAAAEAKTSASGIGRDADGTLQLDPALRKHMQLILDEVQSTGVDELDKVSLERLADINPDLLKQIKEGAEAAMEEEKQQRNSGQPMQQSPMLTSANAPPPAPIAPLSDWSKLKLNHLEKSHDLIASLQRQVRSANETTVEKGQLDNTIHLYAAVSASAQLLTDMLQQWKDGTALGYGGDNQGSSVRRKRRYSIVRRDEFTNEGVKKHNDAVIAQLYEVGLPFVCSADGRRFATQLELSKHLDALFKKSQLEKSMERTDERGWYVEESVWMLGNKVSEVTLAGEEASDANLAAADNPAEEPAVASTVVADETRDRCILCGINFAMFFDQDDGEWKYKNCTEKNVEHDGPTMDEEENEAVLVHATCWEGLGSPEYLTTDQIRHAS